jgi:CDP-glucose 4,6-dehydratase
MPEGQQRGYWHGKSVFVTGAGGFLGGWLCAGLVDAGAQVVGLFHDQPPRTCLDLLGYAQRVTRVRGTLTDASLIERVLSTYSVDTVLHVAARPIVGVAASSPVATFEANVQGTWVVLEACRRAPTVARVIVASTDKAYGDQEKLPYTEEAPLLGINPYDASKVCTDVLARCYAHSYGLALAVTRCANLYGGGDFNFSRIVPDTVRALLAGRAPVIRSDGTPERDYLYIEDAVAAYLTLASHLDEGKLTGHAFNFGTGRPVSVLHVVQELLRVAGRADLRPDIRGSGSTRGEINRQYLDSSKAATLLGWRPTVSLEEGLRRTFTWYQQTMAGDAPAAAS